MRCQSCFWESCRDIEEEACKKYRYVGPSFAARNFDTLMIEIGWVFVSTQHGVTMKIDYVLGKPVPCACKSRQGVILSTIFNGVVSSEYVTPSA